jgi:PleD family two-component response regulator
VGDIERRMLATKTELAKTTMSFSYGLATLDSTKTLQDLIDQADLAMYEQQRNESSGESMR